MRYALLLMGMSLAQPAVAVEEPWMWGVGPRVGSLFGPSDATSDGAPTRASLTLGAEGVYYPLQRHRIRGLTELGLASGWREGGFAFTYNYVPSIRRFQIPFGAGLGASTSRTAEAAGAVRRSWVPMRMEAGVLQEHRRWAWQVMAVGEVRLPTGSVYVSEQGSRRPVDSRVSGRFGLEVSILFGDFLPPRVDARTASL